MTAVLIILSKEVNDVFDLHKYKVTDTAEPYVTVFKARLEQGVLNVPPFDSGEVLKPERGD